MNDEEVRRIVFRKMVERGQADPKFRAAVEPIGFFTLVDLVDAVVDCIQSAYTESEAPTSPVASSPVGGEQR